MQRFLAWLWGIGWDSRLPDLTFLISSFLSILRLRVWGTYFLAVDDSWDLEWKGSFHLLDSSLETFTVSRAGAVAPLETSVGYKGGMSWVTYHGLIIDFWYFESSE